MIVLIAGDWRSIALRGLAAVGFGLLTLIWPGLTLTVLVLLFGVYALIDGVALLANAFRGRSEDRRRKWLLVLQGLASIAAGIVAFVWTGITALALLVLIAAHAFVIGVLALIAAIRLRREIRHEWVLGLTGVLSILFAIFLVITPGAGALVITWLIGWYALIYGASMLLLAWRLRKLAVEITHRVRPYAAPA